MKKKAYEVIYCEDCGKYFDTDEEKEEHKEKVHSGSQSKLFEQVTPIFSDHQDIALDDKVPFSLPPPRGEFNYQEGKLNWEGMFGEQRIEVLKDAMLSTEYAEYSFNDMPYDVQEKIYFVFEKHATTRESLSAEDDEYGKKYWNAKSENEKRDTVQAGIEAGALPENYNLDATRWEELPDDYKQGYIENARRYYEDDVGESLSTEENEQGITDDGTDKEEVEDQFDTWETTESELVDTDMLPNVANYIGRNLEPSIRNALGRLNEFSLGGNDELLVTYVCEDCETTFAGNEEEVSTDIDLHYEETGHDNYHAIDEAGEVIPTVCISCGDPFPNFTEYYRHLKEHGMSDEEALEELRKLSKVIVAKSKQQTSTQPKKKGFLQKIFGGNSLLKSEIDAPYEVTNRNGDLIAQFVLEDWEVQRIIDRYQADYKNEHYGSGDAIVVTASDGQDVSRFFDNTVQDWETISSENIDKQIDYLLGDDNE